MVPFNKEQNLFPEYRKSYNGHLCPRRFATLAADADWNNDQIIDCAEAAKLIDQRFLCGFPIELTTASYRILRTATDINVTETVCDPEDAANCRYGLVRPGPIDPYNDIVVASESAGFRGKVDDFIGIQRKKNHSTIRDRETIDLILEDILRQGWMDF